MRMEIRVYRLRSEGEIESMLACQLAGFFSKAERDGTTARSERRGATASHRVRKPRCHLAEPACKHDPSTRTWRGQRQRGRRSISTFLSLLLVALCLSFALYACSMLLRGIFLLLYSLNATGETFMRFQTMRNRSEIGATESDVSRPLWANFLVADWTSIAN